MLRGLHAVMLVVPDLDACLEAYRRTLGYRLIETVRVSEEDALHWQAPLAIGSRQATLQAPAGPPVLLRVIERPSIPGFDALRCHGWLANEILVQEPSGLADRLRHADSGFRLIGEPAPLASNREIVALQALGPAGELLYFTRLPPGGGTLIKRSAQAALDGSFILVAAGPSLEALCRFHREQWPAPVTAPFEGVVGPTNAAFERPGDATTRMALVSVSPDFALELDESPPSAPPRPSRSGDLPPGWAMVTVSVDRWPRGPWRVPPRRRENGAYAGAWSGVLVGAAGEWLEVVGPDPASTREQATW